MLVLEVEDELIVIICRPDEFCPKYRKIEGGVIHDSQRLEAGIFIYVPMK